MNEPKLISVVLPVFNEEGNLTAITESISTNLQNFDHEIILVDDGSSDSSAQIIKNLASSMGHIKGIIFYRNFGHQNALIAGLSQASGDVVITMDSDFQHPPELLPQLIDKWRQGYDLVYFQKEGDNDSKLRSMYRKFGYLIYAVLGAYSIKPGVSDFRLVDRKLLDIMLNAAGKNPYLRGLALTLSKKSLAISYKVAPRKSGVSGYNFYKLLNLFFSGIFSFGTTPLRFTFLLSIITFVLSIITLTVVNIFNAFLVFCISLIFFCLGIMGEYIGMLVNEVSTKPNYVIHEKYNL